MLMIDLDLAPDLTVSALSEAAAMSHGKIVELRANDCTGWNTSRVTVTLTFDTREDATKFLVWYDLDELEFFLEQLKPAARTNG